MRGLTQEQQTCHPRAYTILPSLIGGGREDATSNLARGKRQFDVGQCAKMRSAHTKRLPFEIWVVEQLDVGIKSVHVYVDDDLAQIT